MPGADRTLDHLLFLLDAARAELDRADQKAALLLAGVGVAAGALLGSLLAHQWSPGALDDRVQWVWWLGSGAAASAVVALGDTVYPRTRTRDGQAAGVTFFGDVVDRPRERFEEELRQTARYRQTYLADQLAVISRIVHRKYRSIKIALWMTALAGVLCLAAAVLDQLLR